MPPRASARTKKLAPATISQQAQSHTADQEAASNPPPSSQLNDAERPRKRQKTDTTSAEAKPVAKRAKQNGKGKRKQDSILSELPLDVVLEIFKWVQPMDLLNLSYTSKELRSILLAGYASSLLKEAYMNLQPTNYVPSLPLECPAHVNLRYYTSVLFGNNCLLCGRSGETIVLWDSLLRLCKACNDVPANVRRIGHKISGWKRLETWAFGYALQKKADLKKMREKRLESIRQKLREEGYINLGAWERRIGNLPGAKIAAPLTDEGWEKIKANYVTVLELQRQDGIKKNMISIFEKRIGHLNGIVKWQLTKQRKPWIYPPLSSIAKSEPFSNIMRNLAQDDDEALIKTKLWNLANLIPDISKTWRMEADEYMLDLLSGAEKSTTRVEGEEIDRTPLELATTFFKCHWCTDPISYPRILMHECLRTKRRLPDAAADEDSDEKPEPLKDVYGVPTVTAEHVWNTMSSWYYPTWNEAREYISVDEESTKFAKAIIQACGEDPETFTAKEMKDRNARFECLRCVSADSQGRSRHIMSWNMAILHDILVHSDDTSGTQPWKLVTRSDDLSRVKQLETKILQRRSLKSYERCRYCDSVVRTGSNDAENHIRKEHFVSNPEKIKDNVYVLLDAPMKAFPCAVQI